MNFNMSNAFANNVKQICLTGDVNGCPNASLPGTHRGGKEAGGFCEKRMLASALNKLTQKSRKIKLGFTFTF